MKPEEFKQFLKQGSAFGEKRAELLSQDLDYLQKMAATSTVGNYLKQSLPAIGTILATAAGSAGVAYYLAKKKMETHEQGLKDSFDALQGSQHYKKDPGSFHQRFSELSFISPIVASNPGLAEKIISPRLKKGFDLDDVHRLSSIEFHTSHSPRPEQPSTAARAQAMIGASNALRFILPTLSTMSVRALLPTDTAPKKTGKIITTTDPKLHQDLRAMEDEVLQAHPQSPMLGAGVEQQINKWKSSGLSEDQIYTKLQSLSAAVQKNYAPIHQKYEAHSNELVRGGYAELVRRIVSGEIGQKKEGSVMKPVSEECLGKMLADSHLMCKEAGVYKSVSDVLKASGSNVGTYLKAMSVPLAIGVGMKMLQGYMDTREKAQLHAAADKVFAKLQRTSDVVQANPAIALDAFDALKSFAPALAVKPIIAKTFVENVVNGQGQLDPNTANMLAQTQQAVQGLERHTGGGFLAGLKEPMSIFSHSPPSVDKKHHALAAGKK